MNEYERKLYKVVAVMLLAMLVLFLMAGCKGPKEIVREVPVYIHDTAYEVQWRHDSIFKDRWHYETVKGDTVYRYDSISIVKWHVKTDTAYQYIEKPVTVTETQIVEVKKPLNWWQKTIQVLGYLLLLTAVGYVGVKVWRKFAPKLPF